MLVTKSWHMGSKTTPAEFGAGKRMPAFVFCGGSPAGGELGRDPNWLAFSPSLQVEGAEPGTPATQTAGGHHGVPIQGGAGQNFFLNV